MTRPNQMAAGWPSDIVYTADTMNIKEKPLATVEAAACEFAGDGTARFVLYGRVRAFAPPRHPSLIAVRAAGGAMEPLRWSVRPMKRAVQRLLRKHKAPGVVQTHGDEDFRHAWRTLVGTGVLIGPNTVLTAAHVLSSEPSSDVALLLHVPSESRNESPWGGRANEQMFEPLLQLLEQLDSTLLPPSPDVADPPLEHRASDGKPVSMRTQTSSDDESVSLAHERRAELLREESWLTSAEVHVRLGGQLDAPGANNRASRLRKSGDLLGVWDGRRYLYPLFQFHPESEGGQLMAETKALSEVLPSDKTGWRQAFWLFQRHAGLEAGARPADVFRRDPQAVLRAARLTFKSTDERW